MNSKDEKSLIVLAQNGNIEAFEKLIEEYQKQIYNLALFKTQDTYLAEEITQETIIKIYRNIRKFKFKSSFYTWIYRITYNILNDLTKKFKQTADLSIDDIQIEDHHDPDNIDKELQQKELSEKLRYLISKIPHKFQFVLILSDIENKSYQEIAEILGVSIGTVKSRLFRARKFLKDIIIKERIQL